MNLAKHGPAAGYGVLLGALGGFALGELGAANTLGDVNAGTIVLFGLVLGAVLGAAGALRWIASIAAALLIAWIVVAYTPLMDGLAPRWVRHDALPPSADAVMVLSSGVQSDSALSADGLDRLLTGLAVAKSNHATELVTSRVARRTREGRVTTDSDQARVVALAGYAGHWDIVAPVRSTHDEAERAAKLLLPGRRRLVLVTSPMHTRRACAVFERVGFVVSCQPAREHQHPVWHPETPADRLASFGDYVYERLGMVKYRHEGWVGN